MSEKQFVNIDGRDVEICGEKSLLEIIRKAGVELPTLCYHPKLSVYGACRMCMVENERGMMEAACHTPPRAGGVYKTNTPRLRKYRRNIIELLLAAHCRDCTTCEYCGKCDLQKMANQFGVRNVRYENTAPNPILDESSPCILKDQSKCILCGKCVRMCSEVQGIGAIDFINRGSKMKVGASFEMPLAESPCVGCGQCAAVCPTGSLIVKNDVNRVWDAIADKDVKVSVQVAPAVRFGIGKELGFENGADSMGLITAALKKMGFDEVFDTSTSADLTIWEEATEFVNRLATNPTTPLFTSCCPAWINYVEKHHPEVMPSVSTCRSPMQMFASIIAERDKSYDGKTFHVAVMPCTAKKYEAARDEFKVDGEPNVDAVITTQELIRMVREAGIVFTDLEPQEVDSPYDTFTGAGVIFGITGGVTEAVLRFVSDDKSPEALKNISFVGIRGLEGVKEATVVHGGKELKIAVVSGLKNAGNLIEAIKNGAHYDFVEVMACPGGCICGGGQPESSQEMKEERSRGIYVSDESCELRTPDSNPLMKDLYNGVLKDRSHELLHVHYHVK